MGYACFVFMWSDMLAFFVSGQRPENPLLLLGQYSDEEVDEESGRDINHDTEKNFLDELDEQVCFLE